MSRYTWVIPGTTTLQTMSMYTCVIPGTIPAYVQVYMGDPRYNASLCPCIHVWSQTQFQPMSRYTWVVLVTIPVYILMYKTDMKHIENVQKRALRMFFNDYSSNYQEILKRAKTCTLEIRWKRQLVTEVYKATHNLTPPYITSLFPPK